MRYRGTTILITGASSGIGAEFARRLGERGADLVLVARRVERLEALAAELRRDRPGIQVTCLAADLARPRPGAALLAALAGRGITVGALVNCAGLGITGPFLETSPEALHQQVDVNVSALTDLTGTFLPGIVAHGSGALVNVASLTAYQPVPGMAVYAATKAFVLRFTEALAYELRGTGVRVLALSPGPTRSEFYTVSGTDESGVTFETPADVVATALRALDSSRAPSVVSGRMNKVIAAAAGLLPRRLVVRAAADSVRPA
ncbi:SDR family oxidoreductase [Couchioplanes caeruleus]|uniref:SDR family NAD(P)-dependent oxidoreductase n=1 Tax=Couchioplanes caeruleus TaxID=56438 RepID=UPI0020BF7126|nr:SDR family oxidoreductase [Couchioplanes caeruleus]UQU62832.1 SDR family oxidoreductase [Couchioplanes caeruleus]